MKKTPESFQIFVQKTFLVVLRHFFRNSIKQIAELLFNSLNAKVAINFGVDGNFGV